MKIYEVSGWDSGGGTTYYEPTKKAAHARVRAMKADGPWDSIEVSPMEIKPTREGICRAMQSVIRFTCANEH